MKQRWYKQTGPRCTPADSSNLKSKCLLRKHVLDRMGITEVYVLDTHSGLGQIWEAMHDYVTIRQWTRCDIKPRNAGVLRLDATEAIVHMPIETYNVIDIDPYGEPWEPYLALLARGVKRETAVFLTNYSLAVGNISKDIREHIGLPLGWEVPRGSGLPAYIADRVLGETLDHAKVEFAVQMTVEGKANRHLTEGGGRPQLHYYGLALAPLGTP